MGPGAHPWMSSGSMNSGFGMKCRSSMCLMHACLLQTEDLKSPVPQPRCPGSSSARDPRAMRTHAYSHTVLHLPLAFFPSVPSPGMPSLPNSSCFWAPMSSLQETFLGAQPPSIRGQSASSTWSYCASLPPLCTWVDAQFAPGTGLHVAFRGALNACSVIL